MIKSLNDKLSKGGEGSGKVGHTTNHTNNVTAGTAKLLSLADKLVNSNKFKIYLDKLNHGGVLDGAQLKSGKPIFLSAQQGVAEGYTPEEHREAGSAHYAKLEQTTAQLNKFKDLGKAPPPELSAIANFHKAAFKGFFNTANRIEDRQNKTEQTAYKMKKSVVSMGHADGAEIDTAKFSTELRNAQDHDLLERLYQAMEGYQYGDVPRSIDLPKGNLFLVQVSEGLFSGVFRIIEHVNDSDQVLEDTAKIRIERMTLPSIVQLCLARGWVNPAPVLPLLAEPQALIEKLEAPLEPVIVVSELDKKIQLAQLLTKLLT
jgi:hypothetical protein